MPFYSFNHNTTSMLHIYPRSIKISASSLPNCVAVYKPSTVVKLPATKLQHP